MEEKNLILKMIEEKKITREEGQKLLDAIGVDCSDKDIDNKNIDLNIKEELNSLTKKIDDTHFSEKISSFFKDEDAFLKNSEYKLQFPNINKIIGEFIVSKVLIKSDDIENTRIEIYSDQNYEKEDFNLEFKTEEEDGLLKIKQIKKDDCTKFFGIKINNIINSKSLVIITVPQNKIFEFISIYSATGSIKANDLYSKQLTLSSSSNSIKAENILSESINVSSNAGSLSFINLKINELAKMCTSAGSISLESSTIKEANLNTNAGNIKINNSDIDEINGHTNAGNVKVTNILGCPSNYVLKSNVGKVVLDASSQENLLVRLNTNTRLSNKKYSNKFESIKNEKDFEEIKKGTGHGLYAKLTTNVGTLYVD